MNSIVKIVKLVGRVFLITWFCVGAARAQDSLPVQANLNRAGVIIDGYDVVSYFIGSPEKGEAAWSENYQGVVFWFANEENKKIFIKNPDKFMPAYGGWCAFAMGDSGKKVKIDPQTYKIIDGKLYLFYNFYANNTLIDWNEDEVKLRQQAEINWQIMNQP